jgi:heme-degrading monooxygenase HmoA
VQYTDTFEHQIKSSKLYLLITYSPEKVFLSDPEALPLHHKKSDKTSTTMAPITEVVVLRIAESAGSLEGTGEGASIWKELIQTIIAQDGVQRLYWGLAVEDQTILRLFVVWESLEHHKKFQASEAHGPFIKTALTIFSFLLMSHTELSPLAKDVFESPAAELLTAWFPAEYTSTQQETVESNIHKMLKAVDGKAKGSRGGVTGWGVENDVKNLKRPELTGKAFFLFIGWDTVEDHEAFRGTDLFKENIHLLRNAEDMQDFLNMHSHLKEVSR